MVSDITTEMDYLQQLLHKGILSVADDLEKELGRPLILAAKYEKEIHCITSIRDESIVIIMPQIPAIDENEYYFHKTKKVLFYQVSQKERRLIIGVQEVKQDEILAIIEKIRLRILALKTYLDMQEQIQEQADSFEKNLAETLVKSSANIYDIIGFHNIDLKTDQYYGILLLEPNNIVNTAEITAAIRAFCAQIDEKRFFPPILWNGTIVVIISATDRTDRKTIADIEKSVMYWQKEVAEQLGVELGCGIGRFYMLNNLHKSYIEAKIALILPSILGKESAVQSFDKLGVFTMIFSQEIGSLKDYVLKKLGPILSYDNEFNMQLVDTMRILLNNDFNWAKTAKDMFVHVNTIYYRYDKIEKILNLDLSKGKDRSEVFAVLKVWDVLDRLGFIGNDFLVS